MEANLALHTAARRYLIDRRADWLAAYSRVPNQGRAVDGYHYREDAKAIFPRYNVLDAIRIEVERLDPDHLPDVPELSRSLVRAGHEAQSILTTGPMGTTEADAAADERTLFVAWVEETVRDSSFDGIEPLAYRRTLSAAEAGAWWSRLEGRWHVEARAWWAPIVNGCDEADTLLLDSEAFWDGDDDGPATRAVQRAIADLGSTRVIELREYGPEYEVDVSLLSPTYDGAEGMFTTDALNWLIFASHEGVTAIGGTIVEPIRTLWPEWTEARWHPEPTT